ncbi:MAG TPA: hypothetical protein VNM92_15545 [Thermoanaerobaculia bacterium]|nr:hypothetical protein [Thermoanaerobaculia bacterium]
MNLYNSARTPAIICTFVFLFTAIPTRTATAQTNQPPVVDLPVVDSDNFADGFRPPSMSQSVALSAGFYEVAHDILGDSLKKRPRLSKWLVGLFDIGVTLVAPMPLSDVWLHEEFHRAVMSNRGIGSFNDVYKFAIGEDAIYVSRVKDDDLVRLKRDHPADLARLHVAGIEGEYALVQRLQRNTFFRPTGGFHRPLYWLVKVSSAGYVGSATSSDVITDTRESERDEGTDIPRRDFAGHDFTAWIYDMSRREEPYTARGIHPSGVGIRRYITPDMLTEEERSFLDRQGKLQYVNLADPHLFGIDAWKTGSTRWNATAGHLLTPFGYTLDLNVLMSRGGRNVAVTFHSYSNNEQSFPGVDIELVKVPLEIAGRELSASPRLSVWSQPDELRFRTDQGRPGGLIGLRLDSPLSQRVSTFVETSIKTEGWVMGNVHLDSDFELQFGVSIIPRM